MRQHLSLLPLFDSKSYKIDPKIHYLPPEFWYNIDYDDPNRPVHEAERKIEVSIDVENKTNSIVNCDTNDPGVKVYVDNKLVNMYDKKYPIAIINLLPKGIFKCTMKAVLSVGRSHGCWHSANSYHYYDQPEIDKKFNPSFSNKNDKNVSLYIQSASLISEYNLLLRSFDYLVEKLEQSKKTIVNHIESDSKNLQKNKFDIEFPNEDHTFTEILNYELQVHPQILVSSLCKPNLLQDRMIISVIGQNNLEKNILKKVIIESCDNAINNLLLLRKKVKEIAKETPFASVDD